MCIQHTTSKWCVEWCVLKRRGSFSGFREGSFSLPEGQLTRLSVTQTRRHKRCPGAGKKGKSRNCIFLRPDSQRCREALPGRPKANWFCNWFAWNVVFLGTPNILQKESERENLLFDHLIELTMLYRFTLCDNICAESRGGRGWGGCDRGGGWEAWACLGRRQGGRGCRGKGSWSESQLARPPPPPPPHSPPGQGGGRWWGWQGWFSLVGGRTRSWASEEEDPLDKLAPLIIFKKI